MQQARESLQNVHNSEEVGILCKKCGEKMRVYKTCAEENSVRRIRKCDDCGIYRVTIEN